MSKTNAVVEPTKTKKVSTDKIKAVAEKTVKAKKADDVTTAAVVKKITAKKDLLYIYPEDVTTLETRKKFRHQCRAALKRYQKAVKLANKSKEEAAIKAAQKDLNNFLKSNYAHPEKLTPSAN